MTLYRFCYLDEKNRITAVSTSTYRNDEEARRKGAQLLKICSEWAIEVWEQNRLIGTMKR